MLFKGIEFFSGFDTAIEDGIQSFDVQRLQKTQLSPIVVLIYDSSVP